MKGGNMVKSTKPEKGEIISPVKKEFSELSKVKKDFTDEQKEFIKNTLAPSLEPNEILLFIYKAQKLGLNPLNGEIFAYGSYETVNGERVRKMVVIVARDGKRKIAFRTGHLQLIETEAIYIKKEVTLKETGKAKAQEIETIKRVAPWEGGQLWGAVCKIVRDDFSTPFKVIVPFSEYKRNNRIWNSKPETMIKKVAQSQCLSEAFPELAGVYDEAERWDDNGVQPLKVEGGDRPATPAQLKTIEALSGSTELPLLKNLTKQSAAEKIRELASKKGKK